MSQVGTSDARDPRVARVARQPFAPVHGAMPRHGFTPDTRDTLDTSVGRSHVRHTPLTGRVAGVFHKETT